MAFTPRGARATQISVRGACGTCALRCARDSKKLVRSFICLMSDLTGITSRTDNSVFYHKICIKTIYYLYLCKYDKRNCGRGFLYGRFGRIYAFSPLIWKIPGVWLSSLVPMKQNQTPWYHTIRAFSYHFYFACSNGITIHACLSYQKPEYLSFGGIIP